MTNLENLHNPRWNDIQGSPRVEVFSITSREVVCETINYLIIWNKAIAYNIMNT